MADCVEDGGEAGVICWLVSARASPLFTFEVAVETDGEKEPLEPAAATELGALALLAEADWASVF